mmetsp:Transcript_28863/g.39641  ORF Transcript_28863/g.39641 Transcript_28863/m.39641 type:complete len:414 (-) Transcript_28863:874-2115(-)
MPITPSPSSPSITPSITPTINSLELLTFTASNTISGLNATVFSSSSSAQSVFKDTVAASMPPVLPSSIVLLRIQQKSSSSRRLRHIEIASTTQNDLIATISYTVSVSFQSIGQSNATLAFQHLSQSLLTHVSNGSFTQTLRRKATIAKSNLLMAVNVTAVSVQPYSTHYETNSPTTSPFQSTASNSNTSGFASWPLYAKILLPMGCILLVAVLVFIVVWLVYHYKCASAATDESVDKTAQKSLSYDDIYGAKSKAAHPRKGRPAAYDASLTPGEEKSNHQQSLTTVSVDNSQVIVTVPEYSSPLRRQPTSPTSTSSAAKSLPYTPLSKKSPKSPNSSPSKLSTPIPTGADITSSNNSPTEKSSNKKKSTSGGRSRTTATVNGSQPQLQTQRSKVLRVDSFRKSKGDFTSGDFL